MTNSYSPCIIVTIIIMAITAMKDIKERLKSKGYRLTEQRLAVLKALQSTTSHPDANWIYEVARKEMPHISLGTIYRTLGVLREVELLRELDYSNSQSHYDGTTSNHYHLICTRCGCIEDLDFALDEGLERRAQANTEFLILEHRLEFYGLCPRCRAHI